MLNRTEIQKSFNFNGVLLVVFNALVFDLLIIGYAGNSDNAGMAELLSHLTIGAFFEAALALVLVFTVYTIILREPLIWLLSRIYFFIILWRATAYPILRVEHNWRWSRMPIKASLYEWREIRRFQLSSEPGHAMWTSRQHLAVATFFVTLLSLVSPLFGFQSLPYRMLPQVLENLGVSGSYPWIWGCILLSSVCFICSKAMMALLGEHNQSYELFRNRRSNTLILHAIDQMSAGYEKALEVFQSISKKEPFDSAKMAVDAIGAQKALIESLAYLKVARDKISDDLQTGNSADFSKALAEAIAETDTKKSDRPF